MHHLDREKPKEPIKTQESAARLRLLFMAAYFCSYLSRHNYGVVLVEIIRQEQLSMTVASAALTGMFITYGLSQILSGFLGDRVRPELLITLGLGTAGLWNLLLPLCRSTGAMTLVWCANGVSQAMCWPPMLKIATENLSGQEYRKTVVWINWGAYLGTIALYLFSPIIIRLSGWRTVFVLCGLAAAAMAAVWTLGYRRIRAELMRNAPASRETQTDAHSGSALPGGVCGILAAVLLAVVLQGILRDGMTSWMPTFISDRFSLGSGVSILSGVFAPVLSILVVQLASTVQKRWVPNELHCAAGAFAAAAAVCAVLRMFPGKSAGLSVALFAAAICLAHAVNLYLVSMIPYRFGRSGHVAAISGGLNAATYLGSAISSYGLAAITERAGWNATLAVWLATAVCGFLICLVCVRSWERMFDIKNN